jgi:hypothetical protein
MLLGMRSFVGGGGPALYLPFALTGTLDPRITFSRPSLATMYDSTGKLTYAPNNLLLQSQNFSTSWSVTNATRTAGITDPFGGTTATQVDFTSIFGNIAQFLSMPPGNYIQSVWVKGDTAGTTTLTGASGGSWTLQVPVTTSWARVAVPFTFTGSAESPAVKKNTLGDLDRVYIAFAQLERVTYQTTPSTYNATTSAAYYGPRFDYNPATLVARGLLIEEARTNLLLYSEDYSNAAWGKFNLTNVTNKTTGPDGVSTSGTLLNENTASSQHGISQSFTKAASATTYTLSCFAKVGVGRTRITLLAYANTEGGNGIYAPFDLSNGQTGTLSNRGAGWPGSTSSITSVGNGWYRCTLTVTTATGTDIVSFVINDSGSGTATQSTSYAGTVGNGSYAYGTQLETGAFATSYIPTAASSVARSADSASMTGTNFSSWYNQTQGTFVYNAAQSATSGTTALAGYTYVDASNASATYHYFNNTAANAQLTSYSTGGAIQVDMGGTSPLLVQGVYRKSVFAYALNDFAVVSTSGSVNTDTSASLPTPTLFSIGSQRGVQGFLNGWIASLAYYNTRLPNDTLQSLTLPVIADYYFLVDANGDQLTDASGNPLYTQPLYL